MRACYDRVERPSAAAEIMQSVTWRTYSTQRVACGEDGIFLAPLDYHAERSCLRLRSAPRLAPGCELELIYKRKGTLSYVMRARGRNDGSLRRRPSIIIKVFGLRRPSSRFKVGPAGPDLLDDHEVEVRYLSLLASLMAHGVTDCGTLVLGQCVVDRATLQRARYVPIPLFPEAGNRGTGMYAVIFAEAADASLTHYLHGLAVGSPRAVSSHELSYQVRAALFQVVYALSTLHALLPSFRHNDLHASNVLVQLIDAHALRHALGSALAPGAPLVVEYSSRTRRWQIDLARAPFRVLLWDFNFASISAADAQAHRLARVLPRCRQFGAFVPLSRDEPNQYVDVHKLFDTLRWVMQGSKPDAHARLEPELQRLFAEVVPPELVCTEGGDGPAKGDRDERKRRDLLVHSELLHTSATELLMESAAFRCFECDPASRARPRAVYRVHGADSAQPRASETPSLFSERPEAVVCASQQLKEGKT